MTIKIVSLNLWWGGKLFDGILSFLKEQDADIVVMQEVNNGEDPSLDRQFRSLQVLQEHLSYPYVNFVADYRDFDHTGGKCQRGNAILSKFPITKQDAVFFGNPYTEEYRDVPGNYQNCPRDLQHIALNTPAGEVNVFNIQGVWDLNGDNYSPQRKQMADQVLQAIAGKPNVILAGDTNAKQTNQAILDIETQLHSVFGRDLATTFNMRQKDNPGYATAAVDGIFVSPGIQVISRECPDADISDHLPLVATLDVPAAVS
jgi:endonuclease/exonuclease/phosphatase family metal-dependent hydrolase